jgi:glutaredoxin
MKQAHLKCSLPLWPALILFCAMNANAQLYKWVGPDGKVTYTDTPPPSSAQRVETRPLASGAVNTAGFPYELSQAVKAHPVTLYTTRNCAPCEEGRKLLSERGIPFTEKTVNSNDDIVQFRKLDNDGELPLLVVGRHQQRGFESSAWQTALTSAGYPERSKLPRSYRNPVAEAAAPAPKAASAQPEPKQETLEQSSSARLPGAIVPPAPAGNAPPGFRF